jgi:transcriptional regulator with XRE-family HTH domain
MVKSIYEKEYRKIISRLREARLNAGFSQQAVADKLGKPQSYIAKIEAGERRVDVAEIKKLAAIYKKEVSHFYE